MNQEAIRVITGQGLAQLLDGPLCRGMIGDIACAWFRMKVDQRWSLDPRGPDCWYTYLATVRGETRRPSLSSNSSAIRFSPQLGFSAAIWRITSLKLPDNGGLPTGRDFHRQNRRKAFRCQPIKVTGLTMTKASRQSKKRADVLKVKRSAAEIRGLSARALGTEPVAYEERHSRRQASHDYERVSN